MSRSLHGLSRPRHNRFPALLTMQHMKQIVLGGVLGGLVLFVWSFIAHLPPLGTAGERIVAASQEPVVLKALGSSMGERAIYMLPGLDPSKASSQQQQTWAARYASGPAAIVAFSPRPADRAWAGSTFATWFTTELLGDMVAGFLGAVIAFGLSGTMSFWRRVLLMAAIGLVATIDIDVSYWNWYGFPTTFLLAQFVDHVGGWFFLGLVVARICRRPQAA
jgi:hypothetical protein